MLSFAAIKHKKTVCKWILCPHTHHPLTHTQTHTYTHTTATDSYAGYVRTDSVGVSLRRLDHNNVEREREITDSFAYQSRKIQDRAGKKRVLCTNVSNVSFITHSTKVEREIERKNKNGKKERL